MLSSYLDFLIHVAIFHPRGLALERQKPAGGRANQQPWQGMEASFRVSDDRVRAGRVLLPSREFRIDESEGVATMAFRPLASRRQPPAEVVPSHRAVEEARARVQPSPLTHAFFGIFEDF